MADVLCEEYASSLNDLTFNSKPHISMLTMLAEENIKHAHKIVQVIEAHLHKVKSEAKLPVIYLIDSIVKNIGGDYLSLFTQNLVSTFCSVFEKVDEKTRIHLFKLRQTWTDVFPNKKLYAIDKRVKDMDPAWPITAQLNPAIHVNPKFLKTEKNLPEDEAKKTQEIQEAEMRKQLIAKQQELLKLQQQKLELELLQTKAKLEEQKRLLHNQHDKDQPQSPATLPKADMVMDNQPKIIPDLKPFIAPPPVPVMPFGVPDPMMQQQFPAVAPIFPQGNMKDPRFFRDPRLARDPRQPLHMMHPPIPPPVPPMIPSQGNIVNNNKDNAQWAAPKINLEEITLPPVPPNDTAVSSTPAELALTDKELNVNILGDKAEERKKSDTSPNKPNRKKVNSKKGSNLRDRTPKKNANFIKKDYKKDDKINRTYDGDKKNKKFDNKGAGDIQKDLKGDKDNRKSRRDDGYRGNFRNRRHYRSNRDHSESPEIIFEAVIKGDKEGKKDGDKPLLGRGRSRSRSPVHSEKDDKLDKRTDDKDKGVPWRRRSPRKDGRSDSPLEKDGKKNADGGSSDVDLRQGGQLKTEDGKDEKLVEEPPSKKLKCDDDKKALDDLFGTKDQDYRQMGRGDNGGVPHGRSGGGWAQIKGDRPTKFGRSPGPQKESGRNYFGDYDQDFRIFYTTDPGRIRNFGRQRSMTKSDDPRLLRRHPMYARFESEFANSQSDVDIPNALRFGKQAEILRQADQQLKSGQLTKEQHTELLGQLAKLYELQCMQQQQREEKVRDRLLNKRDFDSGYGQRSFVSYPLDHLPKQTFYSNSRGTFGNGARDEPSNCGPATSSFAENANAKELPPVLPKPTEASLPESTISQPSLPDKAPDKTEGTEEKPIDLDLIEDDGEAKANVMQSDESTTNDENQITASPAIADKSNEKSSTGLEPDKFNPIPAVAVQEPSEKPTEQRVPKISFKVGRPSVKESRWDKVVHATPPPGKKPDFPSTGIVKEIVPTTQGGDLKRDDDGYPRSQSPRTYDDRGFYRDFRGAPVSEDYRSRDSLHPQTEWKDQWREESFRKDRSGEFKQRNTNEMPPRDEFVPEYWQRRDNEYGQRAVQPFRERTGRISPPQTMTDYQYRDTPYRDYPPVYRPGTFGPRIRYDGARPPPFDPSSRPRFEPVRNRYDQQIMRGRGPPPPIRGRLPYYPEIHRPGFPPPTRHEFYGVRPVYPPQTDVPPPPLPADMQAMTSTSVVAPTISSTVQAPMPQVDVTELFQKLVCAGIIPANTVPKPDDNASENVDETNVDRSKLAEAIGKMVNEEDDKIPTIEFTSENLRIRHVSVITSLYSGLQCSTCGLRFTAEQTDKYGQHLDWHFRQNRRERDSAKKAVSQKWYFGLQDWLQFEELDEGARSLFEVQDLDDQNDQMDDVVTVPVGTEEEDNICTVCQEPFEQFWDEEKEEWHLRYATRVENKTYHPLCYEDIKNAALRESTTADSATEAEQTEEELGSRAATPVQDEMPEVVEEMNIDQVTVKTEVVENEQQEAVKEEPTEAKVEMEPVAEIKQEPADDIPESVETAQEEVTQQVDTGDSLKVEVKKEDPMEISLIIDTIDDLPFSPPCETSEDKTEPMDLPTLTDEDTLENMDSDDRAPSSVKCMGLDAEAQAEGPFSDEGDKELTLVMEEPTIEDDQPLVMEDSTSDEQEPDEQVSDDDDNVNVEKEHDVSCIVKVVCDDDDNVSRDVSTPPIKLEKDDSVVSNEQVTKDEIAIEPEAVASPPAEIVLPVVVPPPRVVVPQFTNLPPVQRGTELSGLCTIF